MLTLCSTALLIAGCGSGGTTPDKLNHALNESVKCIGCHEDSQNPKWTSPGTGQSVVTEWKASTHNTNNGASCKSCHGNDFDNPALHPLSCNKCHTVGGQTFADSSINPDRHGRCAKCHSKANPLGYKPLTYTDPNIPTGSTTAYTHFSTGRHGTYVSTNYNNYCRKCHNPHDTSFGREERKQWAESGHGGTRNAFITSSTDFKTRGSRLLPQDNQGPYCVRCHTTTGYVTFVKSGFTDTQALPDFDGIRNNYPESPRPAYQDKSREGINCNACHDDGRADDESAYSGRVRTVAAPSIWYMYSSHPRGIPVVRARQNVQYDGLGKSNVCVACHAGREVGNIIKIADIDWNLFGYTTAPSAIRPHDFPAAANLQGMAGFDFYTSNAKYTKNPGHKVGLNGITVSCIDCHMKNDRSHSFRPVEWADENQSRAIVSILSDSVCNRCHNDTGNMTRRTPAKLNFERDNYRATAIALGKMIPASNNWKVFGNYSVPGSGTASSTSTSIKKVRAGAYTMGAAFVQILFFNDPAGYTHNSLYARQLMYDAIDWLADGKMDFGSASTQVYNKVAITVAAVPVPGMTWDKGSPAVKYGLNGIASTEAGFAPFTATNVYNFICKDFVADSGICNRW
jgi:hypothetical protein